MSKRRVRFKFDFPDLKSLVERERENLKLLQAATMQTQRGMLFDQEGAYNGHQRWPDLQFRSGQILSRGGARGLRGSIAPRNNGKAPGRGSHTILEMMSSGAMMSVTIGSSLIYAETHDQGATIHAKPGKYLKIPLPVGQWANEKTRGIQKHQAARKSADLAAKAVKASTPAARDRYLNQLERIKRQLDKGTFKAVLFRKKVVIPRRNFTDVNDMDLQEIRVTLTNYLESLITGVGR